MQAQPLMKDKPFDKYQERGAYHWSWYATNKNNYRDKVDNMLWYLPNAGTAIDIGGGDGLIAYQIFKKGLDVTCIDTNKHSIKLAQREVRRQIYGKGLKGFYHQMLANMGWHSTEEITRYRAGAINLEARSYTDLSADESYDYAICHEVIEHIKDPAQLVRIIHHSINEFAIISTPDVTSRPPHPLDYHSWTKESFAEFLSDYKFEFLVADGWSIYVKLYK